MVKTGQFVGLCEYWVLFPLILSCGSSPILKVCLHTSRVGSWVFYSILNICADIWSSLGIPLLSIPCPVNFICNSFPKLSATSLQLRESARLCHWLPFPAPQPGKSLKAVSWRVFPSSCLFPVFKDHFSILPNVRWLWNHYVIHFYFFLIISIGRINLVTISLSWLEVEVLRMLLINSIGSLFYSSQ